MVDQRLNVNLNELQKNLIELKNKIDVQCNYACNIGLVGVQKYADGEDIKVIVRANYPFKTAPFGI